MKFTNLTVRELLTENTKMTFLIGAGCSVDAPSCLPTGREMMSSIIDYFVPESEKQKILNLEILRFEQLIEIFRDKFDPNLNIIDFYGECDKPNLQHIFLAEMLINGHFVITTNFDNLIEKALIQLDVPKEKIKCVITRSDFEKSEDLNELYDKKKVKTLVKVHGSCHNIITGENTRTSLIAIIHAFGKNKKGLNVFQIESFKKKILDMLSYGRTLVVMGYSGSDDFDIVPTLKVLKNLQSIIWINHIDDDEGKEKLFEINLKLMQTNYEFDKIHEILYQIKSNNQNIPIYRIDANISRLINTLLDINVEISKSKFSINPINWFKNKFPTPIELIKYYFSYFIYSEFDMFEEMIDVLRNMNKIVEIIEDEDWKGFIINSLAEIDIAKGNYFKALEKSQKALKIAEKLNNKYDISNRLVLIAKIYYLQGKKAESLPYYEKALEIAEKINNYAAKAGCFNGMAIIYQDFNNYEDALAVSEKSLQLDEEIGNLEGKANRLNTIASIYFKLGRYNLSLEKYQESLQIFKKLNKIPEMFSCLQNIANIYNKIERYTKALDLYFNALNYFKEYGNPFNNAICLSNISQIFKSQGKFDKAFRYLDEAIDYIDKIKNLPKKADFFEQKGYLYLEQGKASEALMEFNKALKLDEKSKNLLGQISRLSSIGKIYLILKDYEKSLKFYKMGMTLLENINNPELIADLKHNIAVIYYEQKKYNRALNLLKESLNICTELKLKFKQANRLEFIIKIYKKMGDLKEAKKYSLQAHKLSDTNNFPPQSFK